MPNARVDHISTRAFLLRAEPDNLSDSVLPSPHPAIIFQKLDDGAVLFAPETELYFGLNGVGARIWELLPPVCHTPDALCELLTAEYGDISAEVIRADVDDLLRQLVAEGLATAPELAGPHETPRT